MREERGIGQQRLPPRKGTSHRIASLEGEKDGGDGDLQFQSREGVRSASLPGEKKETGLPLIRRKEN